MNVPKPIPLAELKEGKLYFKEVTKKMTSKYYYNIIIVKIEKIQLEPDLKKLIIFSYSYLKDYNIFSEITDFDTTMNYSLDICNFLKTYIQSKNSTSIYYFYNFDEEWFLKNKRKILLYYIGNSFSSKKSFLDIFQEIESEKI